jgi:ribA/ribD-fused uncharacterized protein
MIDNGGVEVEFLYFWGHRPERDGAVGTGCLSQWWQAPFAADGHVYPTAEHYLMWHKAVLFGDHEIADDILDATTPARAKDLGREVRNFDGPTWNAHRFDVAVAGSVAKFACHEDLRGFLVGTGDRVLVEASPVDRIWGIGLTADDPRAADPTTWCGLNLLGFALGEARAILRNQQVGSAAGRTDVDATR